MAQIVSRFQMRHREASDASGTARRAPSAAAKNYYIHSKWHQSKFSLFVTDGMQVWQRKFSERKLRQLADSRQVTVQEYVRQAREVLKSQDPNIVYLFRPSSDGQGAMELVWKIQVDPEDDLRVEYKLDLQSSLEPDAQISEMLDFLISENKALSKEKKDLDQDRERFQRVAQEQRATLEMINEAKNAHDLEMYSKFTIILNEKKFKIRELRARLEQAEQERVRAVNSLATADVSLTSPQRNDVSDKQGGSRSASIVDPNPHSGEDLEESSDGDGSPSLGDRDRSLFDGSLLRRESFSLLESLPSQPIPSRVRVRRAKEKRQSGSRGESDLQPAASSSSSSRHRSTSASRSSSATSKRKSSETSRNGASSSPQDKNRISSTRSAAPTNASGSSRKRARRKQATSSSSSSEDFDDAQDLIDQAEL
mmetsp:Transcript_9901/g.30479  ORF Transcript_9901/g.30479 Transcript_9901/m.30479 type:complete len:424 (+) Transcript_9901:161-1432(+)